MLKGKISNFAAGQMAATNNVRLNGPSQSTQAAGSARSHE
jgi:hypothetical protein